MKIGIIFPKDSEAVFNKNSKKTFGGATVQLYNIAKKISTLENFRISSIINDYKTIQFDDSSYFHFIKTYNSNDFFILKTFKIIRALFKSKQEVIIQRGLTLESCLFSFFCRIVGVKFIFMFAHDRELEGRYQHTDKKCLIFNLLLNCASALITQSKQQFQMIPEKYIKKSYIVSSGYEIPLYNKDAVEHKKIILWVGRLEPWKRPEIFMELALCFPEEKFVMIAPKARNYELYFEETSQKTKTIPNITFIDFVHYSEIDLYFRESKVFINTSVAEGFPNTFIQAGITQTPVISLVVDPDNFIQNNDVGFVCNNNINILRQNLKLLLTNKTILTEKSENIYNYVYKNHNIDSTVESIINIISDL